MYYKIQQIGIMSDIQKILRIWGYILQYKSFLQYTWRNEWEKLLIKVIIESS